jgi:predicted outer membrane repeat protein
MASLTLGAVGAVLVVEPAPARGQCNSSPILCVNDDATGANNGGCWAGAYRDLQDALACARNPATSPPITQIWVAAGTYYPDTCPPCDVTRSFELVNGVALYGGFAGDETLLAQRCPSANVTTLSGDIDHNDTTTPLEEFLVRCLGAPSPTAAINDCNGVNPGSPDYDIDNNGAVNTQDLIALRNNSGNSQSVVRTRLLTATTVIDGFTIRAGAAIGGCVCESVNGGGLRIMGSYPSSTSASSFPAPTVRHCLFTDNHASNDGGGAIWLQEAAGAAQVEDCRFEYNSYPGTFQGGTGGGAIHNHRNPCCYPFPKVSVSRCHFFGNVSGKGGATFDFDGSHFSDCTFSKNRANKEGGAVYTGGNTTVTGCSFLSNRAEYGGGLFGYASWVLGSRCLFTGNRAEQRGGGYATIPNYAAWRGVGLAFINSVFVGNTAGVSGGGV